MVATFDNTRRGALLVHPLEASQQTYAHGVVANFTCEAPYGGCNHGAYNGIDHFGRQVAGSRAPTNESPSETLITPDKEGCADACVARGLSCTIAAFHLSTCQLYDMPSPFEVDFAPDAADAFVLFRSSFCRTSR